MPAWVVQDYKAAFTDISIFVVIAHPVKAMCSPDNLSWLQYALWAVKQ